MRRFALLLVLLAASASWAQDATSVPAAPELPSDLISRLLRLPIPDRVDICGEEIPLEREDVRERLEYEMAVILGSPVQTSAWIKRVPRFFPLIETALLAKGLPLDLRFVSVVESNLKAESLSQAGASGPWQFIPDTARAFGLKREAWCDERRDWGRSTEAALNFLSSLRRSLGSWPLAFAAYNAGEGRVRDALERQREQDFFALKLPTETERYVLRIIAAKLILENPARYGIDTANAPLYAPMDNREICIEVARGVSLSTVAKAAGVTYRYLLRLNPWLSGSDLPRGRYVITVPDDTSDAFVTRMLELGKPEARPAKAAVASARKAPEDPAADSPAAPAPPADGATVDPGPAAPAAPVDAAASARLYLVQPGDTLSSIARRHDVKVRELMEGNGLTSASILKPGQELKVPAND